MYTPILAPCTGSMTLPAAVPQAARLFDVRRGGSFGPYRFHTGERLVFAETPTSGDIVALVARGPGRPRLGWISRNGLLGDRGEPCLPERWEVAGKLIGVLRSSVHGWSYHTLADDAPHEQQPPLPVALLRPARATPPRQLSLFAA